MFHVFIDGGEGTTGLRIYERIKARGDCGLLTLPENERKDSGKRREMIHASDFAFLCLPDDAAKEAVSFADNCGCRIIDASTAHRTSPSFVYGFPEIGYYDNIQKSGRVAVPGCHASGFLALTVPLIETGLLSRDALLSCFSMTGYSGGGKRMIAEYESEAKGIHLSSTRHYALSQSHKHLKEITHVSGLEHAPVFNPVIGDFYAGMVVTVPLHTRELRGDPDYKAIRSLYAEYYANRPIIRVLPEYDDFLPANALAGNDSMEIIVAGNDQRICLMARYDNLGKGASGAAVQCMNIMLGVNETTGLTI